MRAATAPAAAMSTSVLTEDQILETAPRPDWEDESVTISLLPLAGPASAPPSRPVEASGLFRIRSFAPGFLPRSGFRFQAATQSREIVSYHNLTPVFRQSS